MSLALYLTFVATVTLLMLIPGPNVALITANSFTHGTRAGLLTVAGTSAAMVAQLAVTALGLTAVLSILADGFEWLRWAGVVYLAYLGLQLWARPVEMPASLPSPRTAPAHILARGFLISLTNPKTLLFYSTFFPQFVTQGARAAGEITLLCVTFVVLALVIDSGWAILAGQLRGRLRAPASGLNRLTGGLLVSAAVGLAFARKSS